MTVTVLHGDCREVLRTLPDKSVHMCVTSPPYFGLRSYLPAGHPDKAKEMGSEATPAEFVGALVEVFREVRRVLRDDGTLWLNLGDSYATGTSAPRKPTSSDGPDVPASWAGRSQPERIGTPVGLKTKDLIGIPWSVAKALQQPYYTGRIPSEIDRAWLAAIIDGEGSICGFHHVRKDDGRTRTGIHINITNSSISLLDECFRIWPTSRRDHNMHGVGHLGKLDTHRWIAHDVDEKAALMRELWPYLIAKKKQAILAWNFLEMSRDAKRLGKVPTGDGMREKRSWIVHALSALNAQRSVDIPEWIVEPPSLHEPGWYLRQDNIWAKRNCMPESIRDRTTRAHEYMFMLTKKPRYFYDATAIEEEGDIAAGTRAAKGSNVRSDVKDVNGRPPEYYEYTGKRNKRSVWWIATHPYPEAHYATFPPDLIEPCIMAGTSEKGCCAACGAPLVRQVGKSIEVDGRGAGNGFKREARLSYADENGPRGDDAHWVPKVRLTEGWSPSCQCDAPIIPCTVLDPFGGAGTTGLVADRLQRNAIMIELNEVDVERAKRRIHGEAPLLATVA